MQFYRSMAPTAVITKPLTKIETAISEGQSLALTQQLVLSVFSSISFIREIFKDDAYEDYHIEQVKTKRIKRGVSRQADRILDWIEKGCFDAIEKKYLESAVFGIFEDKNQPTVMLETYKLSLYYPASKLHQTLYPQGSLWDGSSGVNLCINSNSQEAAGGMCELKINSKESFRYQLARMIRSICMITQRLDPLPRKKFMTMQLTYYDSVTPKDYEPAGFRSTIFDVDLIFEKDPFVQTFGPACSTFHQMALQMRSVLAGAFKEIVEAPQPAQIVPDQVAVLNTMEKPLELPKEVKQEQDQKSDDIACPCGDQTNDTEMVQCERCEKWQHTSCAGFCSNNDRRIGKGYTCIPCLYGPLDGKTTGLVRDFTRKRRTIGILFSDGIASGANLRSRLQCSAKKIPGLLRQLEEEKILQINRLSHVPKITKITSKETKDYIISQYFSEITLEKHPTLAAALFQPKKPAKIKSSTASSQASLTINDESFDKPKKRPKADKEAPSKTRKSAVSDFAQDGVSSTLD